MLVPPSMSSPPGRRPHQTARSTAWEDEVCVSEQIVSVLLPGTHSSGTGRRLSVTVVTLPARRPGPRSDVDVPTALVDAAEQLFGSASVDAVSLRAVARAAGVAPAALTHYFPDKTALVEAVLRRRADPVG